MITIRIKNPVGKKAWTQQLRTLSPLPFSLAVSRWPLLSMGLPSTGKPPHPSHRKMREAQITFYIARDEPWPDGGG